MQIYFHNEHSNQNIEKSNTIDPYYKYEIEKFNIIK